MHDFAHAQQLFEKAIVKAITPRDLDEVISWDEEKLSVLFACTDQVRRHFFGSAVVPCAIMNIKSGACGEDCAFCAQSAHNKASVDIKKLSGKNEIVQACRSAREHNLDFGVVSSGRALSAADMQLLIEAIGECGGPVHASLGILTDAQFALLREAGVVCFNHNLETSRRFFPNIVTTHSYDDRVETVRRAKRAGLKVCCGAIFGMGETWEDRKELCLELRELDVDTVPINFLNAIPGTRLMKPKENAMDFLKIVALFRLGLADKKIKVCGGREVNLGRLQPLMFYAGANGYISGNYLTTAGDGIESDERLLEQLGLETGGA